MVKAGKFSHRALTFAVNKALDERGLNSPAKLLWWGTVMKNRNAGTAMTLLLHGAGGGTSHGPFDAVDFIEVHSRPHSGTTSGGTAGSMCIYFNHTPTVFVPATSNIGRQSLFLMTYGRGAR